jgi:hypothetical protein
MEVEPPITRQVLRPLEIEVTTQEVATEDATEVATEQEFKHHKYLALEVFEHREVVQRLLIAFMFDNTFQACEDRSKWFGPDGISKKIKKALNINHGTKIFYIFQEVIYHKKNGKHYAGKTKPKSGGLAMIAIDSIEAQIIVDALESDFSTCLAHWLVNQHCKEAGTDSYTLKPIKTCYKKLKPRYWKILKIGQGSYDVNSAWAKARQNWNTQPLIRFGLLGKEDYEKLRDPTTREIPK